MTTETPKNAEQYRAAVLAIIGRLHALEQQALGATGRQYRELSDDMNALEELAIAYTHIAIRLERAAE